MQAFSKNIITLYGEKGKQWLAMLEQQLQQLEKTLDITLQAPFEHLSYHYVAPAHTRNGKEVVLKLGIPNQEMATEIVSLTSFNGKGFVKLLQSNAQAGWMLLERCTPGTPLSQLSNDEQATRIASTLIQSFDNPKYDQKVFKPLIHWLRALDDSQIQHQLPPLLLDAAKSLRNDLIKSQGTPVLLHGDLHHDNILQSTRQPWLAIDPKGIIGEREYEFGALIRNPYSVIQTHTDLKTCLSRRFAIIHEMCNLDIQRIQQWSFIQTILSAAWHLQDGTDDVKTMLLCAQVLFDDIICKH